MILSKSQLQGIDILHVWLDNILDEDILKYMHPLVEIMNSCGHVKKNYTPIEIRKWLIYYVLKIQGQGIMGFRYTIESNQRIILNKLRAVYFQWKSDSYEI